MKPQIDMYQTLNGIFLTSKKLKSRLRRYWGTEWIYDESLGENVEVLKKKMIIYPGTNTKRVRMIANLFGIWHDIKDEKFKDIDKYWLYLNYKKDPDRGVPIEIEVPETHREQFVEKINSNLILDQWNDIVINVSEKEDPNRFAGMTKQELLDYAVGNFGKRLFTDSNVSTVGNTLTQELFGKYVYLEGADAYVDTEVISAAVTPIRMPEKPATARSRYVPAYYITSIQVTARYKRTGVIPLEGEFTDNMFKDSNPTSSDIREIIIKSPTDIEGSSNYIDVDELNESLGDEDPGKTNSKWLKGRLRMNTFNSHVYDRDDFTDLISKTLRTDYKVEEKGGGLFGGFFGTILAIVIIVVAIWFGQVQYLGALAAQGATVAFGLALGVASITLAVGQMILARGGADKGLMNTFGTVVEVVGIMSIIAGIGTLVSNIGQKLAQGSLMQMMRQAVTNFFQETIVTNSVAQVSASTAAAIGTEAVKQTVITTSFRFANVISAGMKLITNLVKMRQASRLEGAQQSLKGLQDEVARSNEELEDMNDKELHIGVEDIKWYTNQLAADNNAYNIDHLYEGTRMNICRPTFMSYGLNLRDFDYEYNKFESLNVDQQNA